MSNKKFLSLPTSLLVAASVLVILAPGIVYAHCDTLDGPVVTTAKKALEKGDVTPVLKWVKKENDVEVRKAFQNTLAVRKLSKQAKELADMYLFETLVRLHRAGEGAPYTGLKPAGIHNPIVEAADRALETGKADELKKHITDETMVGIQKRFSAALERKKHADENIEAGRAFVEAYVEFVHYVESIFLSVTSGSAHHAEPGEESALSQHKH